MASIADWLQKPEYAYRPTQIVRRLRNAFRGKPEGMTQVMLPWGLPIEIWPAEMIGAAIWRMGLYDLTVTEAIWRLLDPGERAVDAGTNIGHMSSVMAVRAGPQGRVDAFEPHPLILKTLQHNVRQWTAYPFAAKVIIHAAALSQVPGRVALNIADDFEMNHGNSFIGDAGQPPASHNTKCRSVEVDAVRLDDALGPAEDIGVMKIDVEGHELAVLNGATAVFDRGGVRDVIFEEHRPFPTDVTAFFEQRGYSVYRLDKRFFGLDIRTPGDAARHRPYDPPNFLATRDPARARQRFATRGWSCLRPKPSGRDATCPPSASSPSTERRAPS